MAIITAEQLKSSREARAAGVESASDPEAEQAIRVAEAVMNKALGYRVANADDMLTLVTRTTNRLMLPERVRTISEITEAIPGGDAYTVEDTYEIRSKGFALYRTTGWRAGNTIEITGEFGYEPTEDIESMVVGDDEYVLAEEFVTKYAVRLLERSSTDRSFPTSGGAVLTGFSSENAQFTQFTPAGELTEFGDLDPLLRAIGLHPSRKDNSLYTIGLGTSESVTSLLDFDFHEGRL